MPPVRHGSGNNCSSTRTPACRDGGEGLVQDPERRPVAQPEPGQGHPSLLPGRELARGIVLETGEADLGQHPPQIHSRPGWAVQLLVEGEVLEGSRSP